MTPERMTAMRLATSLPAYLGAEPWMAFEVSGSGRQGERTGEIPEYGNVQVEVIVPPATAEALLQRLQREYFSRASPWWPTSTKSGSCGRTSSDRGHGQRLTSSDLEGRRG